MTQLSPAQLEALRTLRTAYPEAQITLIGAAALGFHVPMTWRNTADIDLVLAMSVSELETGVSKLSGWEQDTKQQQRWWAPKSVPVDLVPVTPDALERGQLVWPKTQQVMNLGGIRLALQAATRELATSLSIAVPSVPVIALLKMAAYLDRPDREKDLQDLAYILNEYPSVNDDRLYAVEIYSKGLDDQQARGFILGQELRAIVNSVERKIVDKFLETVTKGHAWMRFVAAGPRHFLEDAEEQLQLRLDAFRGGFATAAIVTPEADPHATKRVTIP